MPGLLGCAPQTPALNKGLTEWESHFPWILICAPLSNVNITKVGADPYSTESVICFHILIFYFASSFSSYSLHFSNISLLAGPRLVLLSPASSLLSGLLQAVSPQLTLSVPSISGLLIHPISSHYPKLLT